MRSWSIAYFADGSTYAYGNEPDSSILNAGWLDQEYEFPTGPVPSDFVRRLFELANRQVNLYRGYHRCNLCRAPLIGEVTLGPVVCTFEELEQTIYPHGEIRVAEPEGARWAAPSLVVHYVVSHDYQPPEGFMEAVLHGTPLPDPQHLS